MLAAPRPLFTHSVFHSLASCAACAPTDRDSHPLKPRQRVIKRRSDQYEFYCCYCRHGDDIFRDAISHVIYSHKHQVIRLGQRSEKKEADTKSGPLLFIRQWDVIPNSVLSDGRTIKVNKETEQLEICEPVYKA
ncbi:uncharacterized protein LOC111125034 [Crassostrea virginica]